MNARYWGWLPALAVSASPVQAIDLNWSGFGTVGYAQSDQPYKYQRFIDDSGTLKRDSILGAQLDARFSPQLSLTVQGKVAPSDHSDDDWRASLAWAFVSWRPNDDWLLRAGKLRLPLMLNTENIDVGATFVTARLPLEVYSIAPTNDIYGLLVSRSWFLDSAEWTLEGYAGQADTYQRYYGRETTPDNLKTQREPGSFFTPFRMFSSGLVLTVRDFGNVFRIGLHNVNAKRIDDKSHADIPLIQRPGYSYYDVLAGRSVDELNIPVQTIGASYVFPAEIKVTAEYARATVHSASEGLSRWGAYVNISRRFGDWTPYGYYAKMKSNGKSLELYQAIEASAQRAPTHFLHDYQKLAADVVSVVDQWTGALGVAYRVTPTSLLKAEWSQTHTGIASSLVDAPSGTSSGDRSINVYSLSYSFTF